MTPAEIARLREVIAAATPGPWAPHTWYGTDEGGWVAVGPHHLKSEGEEWDDPDSACHERAKRDAEFIALARNHWDELLAEIERLRSAIGTMAADHQQTAGDLEGCRRQLEDARRVAGGVVANAGRLATKRKPRWSHVMDATGQGSTAAHVLCREHGFDPDEEVGGPGCTCTSGALAPEDTCPAHGSECAQCAEYAQEIESYEAAIEESLPEYVLDDGTDEPANYLERIEYAGQAARLSLKYRDERDARKARILLIRYENENETIRPEVGTGECIDDLTALVDLDEEVSRG